MYLHRTGTKGANNSVVHECVGNLDEVTVDRQEMLCDTVWGGSVCSNVTQDRPQGQRGNRESR